MKKLIKRKWLRVLTIIILSFVVVITILQLIPPSKDVVDNPFIKKEDQGVLIAAHRGGKNLNPENTFKAFDYSINNYHIDILELDLVMTKDKQLVSIHNSTINATSDVVEVNGEDRPYYVNEFTLEELLEYNFGYKFKDTNGNFPYRDLVELDDPNRKQIIKDNDLNIVTIDEIFFKYKDSDLMYIVEIKDSGELGLLAADHLNDLLETYSLFRRVTIGTFHDDIATYLRETYPNILKGGSVGDVMGFVITQMFGVNLFYPNRFANLQIPVAYKLGPINVRLAKSTYVNRAHRRGISVQFWTINKKEDMRKLIDLGADVIMTDSPDILYELLQELGYR